MQRLDLVETCKWANRVGKSFDNWKTEHKTLDLPWPKTFKLGDKAPTLQSHNHERTFLWTAEELFSEMHNANFFTKLNTSSDYCQK